MARSTPTRTALDGARAFFADLAARGHEPLLGRAVGTLRLDLVDGETVEHWYVAIDRGDVTVSDDDAPADSVVRADRSLFVAMTRGTVNLFAAALRGLIHAEGDLGLLVLFQRVFPAPPRPGRSGAPRRSTR